MPQLVIEHEIQHATLFQRKSLGSSFGLICGLVTVEVAEHAKTSKSRPLFVARRHVNDDLNKSPP